MMKFYLFFSQKVLTFVSRFDGYGVLWQTRIRLHIYGGDGADVQEQPNEGLVDFGVLFEPTDLSDYNHLAI